MVPHPSGSESEAAEQQQTAYKPHGHEGDSLSSLAPTKGPGLEQGSQKNSFPQIKGLETMVVLCALSTNQDRTWIQWLRTLDVII